MNTDVGGIEILSNRRFIYLSFIFVFLAACSKGNRQLEDIPIVVAHPGQQKIDVNLVINNSRQEIQKVIPEAYLTFFSYVGECKELPELQGEIQLDFAQNKHTLFGVRTLLARASINTVEQTLSFDVKDETEHYPDLEPLSLDGKGVQEIADLFHAHLVSTDRCTGTIALTRAGTDSPWRARCGHPDKVLVECLRIDPLTGDILEVR